MVCIWNLKKAIYYDKQQAGPCNYDEKYVVQLIKLNK